MQTRAQAAGDPGGTSPGRIAGPVACPSHVDAVPRRAVRKVGPRPDLTRSTHTVNLAARPGCLGMEAGAPVRPTERRISQRRRRMKNGGSNPPAPGNRCVGGPRAAYRAVPGASVFPLLYFLYHPSWLGFPSSHPAPRSAPGRTARTSRNSPLFGPAIGRGSRGGRIAYLTFTTAPTAAPPSRFSRRWPPTRSRRRSSWWGARATLSRRRPPRRRQGHAVGNHTLRHRKLHFFGPARVREELEGAHEIIASVTGRAPRVVPRPARISQTRSSPSPRGGGLHGVRVDVRRVGLGCPRVGR